MIFRLDIWRRLPAILVIAGMSALLLVAAPRARAQSGDAAVLINQLEEQVRQMNGKVEELNFQLLQLQEQIRRMQEDNEFRFQELEGKKQGRLNEQNDAQDQVTAIAKVDKKGLRLGKPQPSESRSRTALSDGNGRIKKIFQSANRRQPKTIDGVEIYQGPSIPAVPSAPDNSNAKQPLGTITFDAQGNVVDSALGKPLDLTARLGNPNDVVKTTKIPAAKIPAGVDLAKINSPRELYELAFEYFQGGDYVNAQRAFTQFSEQFPDDRKIANAQFWLGESLFSQGDFKGAAKVYLDTQTNWPDAKIAPQALLKLGISLAGLEQRELACATYAKVRRKYPNVSKTIRKRVRTEQKASHCLNG